ncbi:MAG: tetratricopeptide repeat protein [Candidatus Brocadiae bacterium]|nr:tetratricopeptide repeat protein [Candidatus Brocadiia bacterium]
MENTQERMPVDRWLVQESFKHIAQGPKAFRNWALSNAPLIDQKFINQLKKMADFSRKNNNEEQAKAFEFLEKCINKLFDLEAFVNPITVTEENFQKNYDEGLVFLKKNKPKYSIPYFHALLAFLNHKPNQHTQGILYSNLGIAYIQSGSKEKGIEYLKNALDFPLADREKEKVYANLGTVYRDTQKFSLSIEFHKKSLEIAQKYNDKEAEFVYTNHLALVYLDQKQIQESIHYQKQALEIAKILQNTAWIKDCTTKMAVLYALQGDKEGCKEFCEKGLSL